MEVEVLEREFGEGDTELPRPCVFTVRELDERAYKPGPPFYLKIGPYVPKDDTHLLEEALLNDVLQRISIARDELLASMASSAKDVRKYFEAASYPGFPGEDQLVMTLVRDGCFVLELMHIFTTAPYPFRTLKERLKDIIFLVNTTMLRFILLDVLMIKNQIPFPFLRQLYKQLKYEGHRRPEDGGFEGMVGNFLDRYGLAQSRPEANLASACHLLDAARIKLLPGMVPQNQHGNPQPQANTLNQKASQPFAWMPNVGEMSVCYSAVDLEHSGVVIKQAPPQEMVTWRRRKAMRPVLRLPKVRINRDSHIIFRNMVAYEQRLADDDPTQPVSSYLRLLSDLILSVNDGRALISRGIIDNQLGSVEELVKFFRDLNLRDTYGIDMLSDIRRRINKHCQTSWISSYADPRRSFFRTGWPYWTFAGAIVLLILTALQVVYAVLSYHRSPK